jgi:hypothetical protein
VFNAEASWLCKETAAVANGDSITTCGIASDKDQQKARDKAFESAKEEYFRFCDPSPNCRDYEFKVEPMRVDCTNKDMTWTCYRALGFTVLKQKKKNISVDIEKTKKELTLKENQLEKLKKRLSILEKSKKVDDELLAVKNKIIEFEADTITLKDKVSPSSMKDQQYKYIRDQYDISFKLSTLYYSFSTSDQDFNLYGIGLKLEKRFFKKIGLNIGYEWGSDFNAQDDFKSNSIPNSTKTEIGITKVNKASIGVTVYPYKSFYLSGELGTIDYETQSTTASYTALGVKGSERKSFSKGTVSFQKIAIGYDSLADNNQGTGFYYEIGALKSESEVSPNINIGINFGF